MDLLNGRSYGSHIHLGVLRSDTHFARGFPLREGLAVGIASGSRINPQRRHSG